MSVDKPLKQCKWCNGYFEKLAKSHIIPSAFFDFDGKNNNLIVSVDSFRSRSRTGPWDDSILCYQCESDFNYIDSKAIDILLNKFSELCVPFGDKKDDVSYRLNGRIKNDLKIFLIYTLWRCSVSQRKEFDNIRLGPFEDKIKQDIIEGRNFSESEYGFVSFYMADPKGILFPFKKKKGEYQGCNFYHIDLHNFFFDIKIDSRDSPSSYKFLMGCEDVIFIKINKIPPKRLEAMKKMVSMQKDFEDSYKQECSS